MTLFWPRIWQRLDAAFPLQYRVVHQKVAGSPSTPKVERIVHGPFRFKLPCVLLAYLLCGPWDRVEVQERVAPAEGA